MFPANQHLVLVRILKYLFLIRNFCFFLYLDMEKGTIADMIQLGILESFHLKRQVVISAAEAAEMVLRIDNIIRAPPRPRQRDMRHH
jgi:hypothetical protein